MLQIAGLSYCAALGVCCLVFCRRIAKFFVNSRSRMTMEGRGVQLSERGEYIFMVILSVGAGLLLSTIAILALCHVLPGS